MLLPIEIEALKGYTLYNYKLSKLDHLRLPIVTQQTCPTHQHLKKKLAERLQ